jgi:hypothetical protein
MAVQYGIFLSRAAYLRLVIAFPRQQWLRERASVLRYTYIVCFVTPLNMHLISNISVLTRVSRSH